MISDYHLHSRFSGDSAESPEAIILRAVTLGMKHICFTDHLDMDFPPCEFDFSLDTEAYFAEMRTLKEKYAGQIAVRIGVELGLQPHLFSRLAEFTKAWPFDFVIGSVHISRGLDPYDAVFWEGLSEDDALEQFFRDEAASYTECPVYDAAGHLDYVLRNCCDPSHTFALPKWKELFHDILQAILSSGRGIECNTSGIRAGQGFPNPHPDLLKMYREMGGEIITIGSDAHRTENIGYGFDKARELLLACGFRYYTVFKERKPEFLPL